MVSKKSVLIIVVLVLVLVLSASVSCAKPTSTPAPATSTPAPAPYAKPSPAPTTPAAAPPTTQAWVPPVPGMKPGEEKINVKWTISMGTTIKPQYESVVWWANEMDKRTGGRFKSEIIWGTTLATLKETPQIVKGGMVQMGMAAPSYNPSDLYLGQATGLLLLSPSDFYQIAQLYAFIMTHPSSKEQFAKMGLIPTSLQAQDPSYFLSKKPMRTASDWKGLRIEGTGTRALLAREMGMVPQDIASTELYEAVQRGMLDVTFQTLITSVSFRLPEVAKYLIDMPIGSGSTVQIFNKKAWDDLPQYMKDIHFDLEKQAPKVWADRMTQALSDVRNDLVKKYGVEIIAPTKEFQDALAKAGTPVYESWITEGEKIKAPARPFLKDVIAFRDKLTGQKFFYQP